MEICNAYAYIFVKTNLKYCSWLSSSCACLTWTEGERIASPIGVLILSDAYKTGRSLSAYLRKLSHKGSWTSFGKKLTFIFRDDIPVWTF